MYTGSCCDTCIKKNFFCPSDPPEYMSESIPRILQNHLGYLELGILGYHPFELFLGTHKCVGTGCTPNISLLPTSPQNSSGYLKEHFWHVSWEGSDRLGTDVVKIFWDTLENISLYSVYMYKSFIEAYKYFQNKNLPCLSNSSLGVSRKLLSRCRQRILMAPGSKSFGIQSFQVFLGTCKCLGLGGTRNICPPSNPKCLRYLRVIFEM